MKGILTVIGRDTVGIIAGISTELLNLNINILDVNQTIMEGYFTMMMMVDLSASKGSFEEVKDKLVKKGEELNVEIKIQREEIFNAMHTL